VTLDAPCLAFPSARFRITRAWEVSDGTVQTCS
jgi:hypothetical protein